MKCPVCFEHYNDSQESGNIFFQGMCSECSESMNYYYREGHSRFMSERDARRQGLNVINDNEI